MKSSSNSSESFDYTGVYRDAYFTCIRPLMPRTEIPRWNSAAIAEHKSTCPKCIETAKRRAQEKELENEGPRRLEYILIVIGKARDDIDYYRRLKAELDEKEQQKGGQEVDYRDKEKLRLAEYDSGAAKLKIKKERIELYKLLNHENEVVRQGAKESYLRYINAMKKLKKEKEAVTPLSPSSPSLSSLKRSLGALT